MSDSRSEVFRVTSNGFEGERIDTSFWLSGSVTVQDEDGRRPEDGDFSGGRFVSDLGDPTVVGRSSAQRALARLGSGKVESKVMTLVLDNRAGGRLAGGLLSPLAASSIQQRRSFLEGRAGSQVGSDLLHIVDDPPIPKGFGSRHFDGEGISARKLPLFEAGVLRLVGVGNDPYPYSPLRTPTLVFESVSFAGV